MTHEEWTRSLIAKLASGFMDGLTMSQAREWLNGNEVPEKWEPKAKKEFENKKK